jgi:hypothetical protein
VPIQARIHRYAESRRVATTSVEATFPSFGLCILPSTTTFFPSSRTWRPSPRSREPPREPLQSRQTRVNRLLGERLERPKKVECGYLKDGRCRLSLLRPGFRAKKPTEQPIFRPRQHMRCSRLRPFHKEDETNPSTVCNRVKAVVSLSTRFENVYGTFMCSSSLESGFDQIPAAIRSKRLDALRRAPPESR